MQKLHISPLTMKDVNHFRAELPEKPQEENTITQLWNQHESPLSLKRRAAGTGKELSASNKEGSLTAPCREQDDRLDTALCLYPLISVL